MKTAIVTLGVKDGRGGEGWWDPNPLAVDQVEKLLELSLPTMEAYANRIKADLHVVRDRLWPDRNVRFEKFQFRDLLDRKGYDRVLYLDADVMVNPKAPDIFEQVPPGHLGALNETPIVNGTARKWIGELWDFIGGAPNFWRWDEIYFDTGVLVIDKTLRDFFRDKPPLNLASMRGGDRGYLNLIFQQNRFPFFSLPETFNFRPIVHPGILVPEICSEAFAHIGHFPIQSRIAMMKEIADAWK